MAIEGPCALFDEEMEVLLDNASFDEIGIILWVRHVPLSHFTGRNVRVVVGLMAELKEVGCRKDH